MNALEYVKPARAKRDVMIEIDIAKVDAAIEAGFRVGPGGIDGIGDRYQQFGEWIKLGIAIETPEVCLNWKGQVAFTNGRHRFAWLRDAGIGTMMVSHPRKGAKEFSKKFGIACN